MPQQERNEPLVTQLVDTFRTVLDESLVTAIASDYELYNKAGFAAAKEVLESLSQDVVNEEASGFNPSGVHGFPDGESQDPKDTQTVTSATSISQHASGRQRTDSTSSGSGSSDSADATWVAPRVTSFNNDSVEDKSQQLHVMFPGMKAFDVTYALKKCNNDFQSTLDHLLNMQYLEETGQQSKGIDGFAQLDKPKKRKGNGKGRKREPSPDTKNSVPAELIREAKEQSEIGYIAERFNLTFDAVSESYYDNNCSSPSTVMAILDQRLSQDPGVDEDESTQEAISLLSRKYRQVPEKYLKGIVHATNSIMPFSDDLAQLISKQFARARKHKGERMALECIMKPLPKDEIEGSTSSSRTGSPPRASKISLPASAPPTPVGDFSQAIKMSQSLHQAKRDATASASTLYRKGGANGLYRQAAGYYAEQAREHARSAKAATSTAADLLVNDQSSARTIDLHGVSVQDGTRIARQRATSWWQSLGEYKTQEARTRPLTIVTGLGRHSAGGISQLRKSVAAALIQDGWKVQVGTGNFTITGRR